MPYDPDLNKMLREIKKSLKKNQANQENKVDTSETIEDMADNERNNTRPLRDYALPQVTGAQSVIRRPTIEANNFEIKLAILNMIQNSVQFDGFPQDDPHIHITNFLEICDTFRLNGVSSEAIRLRLFPFSLKDRAKSWLNSHPVDSITSWEDLAQKFLAKFFPPSKTAKLRSDISTFQQFEGESLYEACERFKDLLRRCPHHGLPKWMLTQTFYNGLATATRTLIDAASGGSLMSKSKDQSFELLDEMAQNNYQWPSERIAPKKAAGIYEVDALTNLTAQVASLSKQLQSMQPSVHAIQASSYAICDYCQGTHANEEYHIYLSQTSAEHANYVDNYNR